MNKKELLAHVAAIVSALDETGGGCVESTLYMFVNMDMDAWQAVRHVLVGAKLVDIKANYVSLTAEGRATAARINAAMAKVKHV